MRAVEETGEGERKEETYSDQSDPGPYPLYPRTRLSRVARIRPATGTRSMVNPATCTLYELWDAHVTVPRDRKAGSGAIWDLDSDALRPAGWTSADAAGLPILPGLVNYDEASFGGHGSRHPVHGSMHAGSLTSGCSP